MKTIIILIVIAALSAAFMVHNTEVGQRLKRIEELIGLSIQIQIQTEDQSK